MSKKYCCDEYAETTGRRAGVSRRMFLQTGGVALLSFGFAPQFVGRALGATAPHSGRRKVLVCVFQRGAVDGLNMVIPYGDKEYYKARNNIAIEGPGRGADRALELDGFFALHPSLAPLQPWYRDGHLAVVHAVGSPDATRSHFDAQDYMETGTPGIKSTRDGWLNRLLAETRDAELQGPDSLMRGMALTQQEPRAFSGAQPSLAVGNLQQFLGGDGPPARDAAPTDEQMIDDRMDAASGGDRRPASRPTPTRQGPADAERREALMSGFEALYGKDEDDLVLTTGAEALDAVAYLKNADPLAYRPENNARYPGGLGIQLRQVAQLIKADVGLEIAFTDIGGWDTHRQQNTPQSPAQGALAGRLTEFGSALAAFAQDLGDRMEDVVVLTMSEFGRTVEENGSVGTDHGHANACMVLGGNVNGGRVYGEWPGLAREQRYEGRDLAITTDFRDVFGEVADLHLAPDNRQSLFPGHRLDPRRYKGLIKT